MGDAADFVLELCSRQRRVYDSDEMLEPALSALRRARSKSPSSARWWEELESTETEYSPWMQACVNCKMSEYLCLTAHIETCEWSAGRLPEEQCLEGAAAVRLLLTEAFKQLRIHGTFTLVTKPTV